MFERIEDTVQLSGITTSDAASPEPNDAKPIEATPVNWLTPWAYLFGQREAIYAIAATPAMLWVGLLLVISAGFAREYDGEDLLHEPWHVAIPVGASLATSFVLFCLCELHARGRRVPLAGFWSRYRVFLALYWMTAPLAWLYAIPVERWSTAGEAVSWNLTFLKIVSLWRVLLITRVISVMYQVRYWGAIFAVVLFGAAVLLAVLSFTPFPLFSIMGGIRLSDGERELAGFAFGMKLLSLPVMAVSFIGMLLVTMSKQNRWRFAKPAEGLSLLRWFWIIPAAALAIWIPILPRTQPEQQLRRSVETDLRAGRIESATMTLKSHAQHDFPPLWDPPPRVGYGEYEPNIIAVLNSLAKNAAPDWVRDIYEDKFEHQYRDAVHFDFFRFQQHSDQEFEALLRYLEQVDPSSTMLRELQESLKIYDPATRSLDAGDPTDNLQPELKQRIEKILDRIPTK